MIFFACTATEQLIRRWDNVIPDEITMAIQEIEADVKDLKDSLAGWDHDSQNYNGSRRYREKANRVVLQAKKIESLIKEKTFSR